MVNVLDDTNGVFKEKIMGILSALFTAPIQAASAETQAKIAADASKYAADKQYDIALKNFQAEQDNLVYQKGLQQTIFDREDNAVQRRMADLQAAGLSPTLASGQGAGAGQAISTQAPKMSDNHVSTWLQGALQAADIRYRGMSQALSTVASMDPLGTLSKLNEIKIQNHNLKFAEDNNLPYGVNGDIMQGLLRDGLGFIRENGLNGLFTGVKHFVGSGSSGASGSSSSIPFRRPAESVNSGRSYSQFTVKDKTGVNVSVARAQSVLDGADKLREYFSKYYFSRHSWFTKDHIRNDKTMIYDLARNLGLDSLSATYFLKTL